VKSPVTPRLLKALAELEAAERALKEKADRVVAARQLGTPREEEGAAPRAETSPGREESAREKTRGMGNRNG
jgi:hypothetical protein